MKLKRMSTKIMLTIIVCVVLVASILGVVGGLQSGNEIRKVAEDKLMNLVAVEAEKIESEVSKSEEFAKMMGKVVSDKINLNEVANNQEAMNQFKASVIPTINSLILGAETKDGWMGFNSKVIYGVNAFDLKEQDNGTINQGGEYDANTFSREGNEWWYTPLEEGEIWTKPFVWKDAISGKETSIVSYGTRVEKDGQIVGVVGTNLRMDKLMAELASVKIYETGYVSLIHTDGTALYHPNEELDSFATYNDGELSGVLKTINNSNKKTDIVYYDLDGEDKVLSYYKLSNGWIALACPYVDEMFAGQKRIITNSVIITLIGILLASIVAFLLGRSLSRPISKLVADVEVMATGNLDVDIQVTTHDEVGVLQETLMKMRDNIIEQAQNAEKIAKGDLSINIVEKSNKDVLALSMKKVVDELRDLVNESNMLSEAAAEGNLKVRGDESKFNGGYHAIIAGTNRTITAIAEPVDVALDFISRLADGSASEHIENSDKYKGVYGELAVNLNSVLDVLFVMHNEVNGLTNEAVAGNLSYRADLSVLKGNYAEIVRGMNNTLDAVIEPIQESSTVLQKMANGDLSARVVGVYKGEHEDMKTAMNFMGETIEGYIGEIANCLESMADKNLTMSISREYLGDFQKLKESINHISAQFNEILSEINMAAEQVEIGSEQVSTSSQSLSQGSSEQASSVEQMSTSITEVAEQTKDNAANANKANELSVKARANAENGNEDMKQMLVSMNAIKDSSNNIANIIKVIDDIAFQTNILALNAAVEAARAGEHGRGFAVVAEEVRNLAARSAEAAKETTSLIDNSINQVNDGYNIAQKTAEGLENIVTGVADAVEIVGEIASASSEQALAIEEISVGIDQISNVTQSNMSTAEESAAASEQMSSQSQELKEMIGEFNLNVNSKRNSNISKNRSFVKNNTIEKKKEIMSNKESIDFEIDLDGDDFGKF